MGTQECEPKGFGVGLGWACGGGARGGGGWGAAASWAGAGLRSLSRSPRLGPMDALCGSGELGSKFWVRRGPGTEEAHRRAQRRSRGGGVRTTPGGGLTALSRVLLSWRPRPALTFPAAWRTWEIRALGCPRPSGWCPRIGVPPLVPPHPTSSLGLTVGFRSGISPLATVLMTLD